MDDSSEKYSILVNSSDGFEDCWEPFFLLLKKYWPTCKAPIYLNTETKSFHSESLNIICTKVQGQSTRRLSWSQCLMAALDQVKTPYVLYFQEDYFIHCPVRDNVIAMAVGHMARDESVKHIALTKHGSVGPYETYSEEWLEKIRQKARYRISTQAALWRVDTLKSYLRAEENGWMFEIYGTWRAHRRKECFLVAKFAPRDGGPAIDYLHTGIIKGKWLTAMKPVFDANGISVDYSKRGFYVPKNHFARRFELVKKLLSNPAYLLKQLIHS